MLTRDKNATESFVVELLLENPRVTLFKTRNSAIADKPRDTFRGQSRSSNAVSFDMLGMICY